MKRINLLCGIVILSLFTVGCAKTIELTDEESKLVAEYAAELLLKYDRNNDSKYYNDEYSDKDPFATTEYVTTEVTTEINSETTTEAVTTEENDNSSQNTTEGKDDLQQDGVIDSNVNTTETISGVVADKDSDYDLASFIRLDNVSIKYQYYMVLDEYPSYDKDGMYVTIEAPSGYKLLVLKFKIENKTNENQYLDLYSNDVEYKIIVDNSKSAKNMLTILMDDLYTYEGNIEGSMYTETVLLFQVSEDIAANIQDLKLKAIYDGEEVVISLQ